jgi:phage terminase large subunit-like protein
LTLGSFERQPRYVGIDLATRSDITGSSAAVSACRRTDDVGRILSLLPSRGRLSNARKNTHYQGWERDGLLVATPGAVTDLDS